MSSVKDEALIDYVHGPIRAHIIKLEADNERLRWLLKQRDETIARLERLMGDAGLKARGQP